MAKVVDNRTDEQRATHRWLVVANDACLSGWGDAKRGRSIAAWACEYKDVATVERWVRSRPEMKRVRIAADKVYGRSGDYIHIYVVDGGHPALSGE